MTHPDSNNPLLRGEGIPPFDVIRPEHVEPALRQLLEEGGDLLVRLTRPETPATWEDFAAPLADGLERISWAWGIVGHLHAVNDIPPWRDAYNAMLPEISRFYSALGQNQALFEKYKALRASREFESLNAARQRVVENEIRDFRLSGAELPEAQKPRFLEIQEHLARLAARFSENLLDATNAYSEIVTREEQLAGIPEDVRAAARASAEAAGIEGWKFTLHVPSFLPVLQYADDRDLRARMYRAYGTRASEFLDCGGKPEWDNTALMREMLVLRQEEARLLGYGNYAEVSLTPKMAESPARVLEFLRDLAAKAKPFAQRDVAELRDFARQELGLAELMPWDVAYVSEKLRQARYAFSEQEVKQYFTEPKVIAGLFHVIERLFGARIRPDFAPSWHADTRFFRIETEEGALIGQFYMDLHAREVKRGGAWMDSAVSRRRNGCGIQTPVAYLNCNFAAPVNGKPAMLTHDEVMTLFHEAGHGFHHLLTRIEEPGVSGISGVEWDAVELPSQFMENFCWTWEVIREMTAHAETGEPLPHPLFARMLAAKNFQSGMMTVRQIEFALFDMLLHSAFDPEHDDILSLLNNVRAEVAVLFPPEWQRFPNSFSHIFGGGYAAGYYSYKWAEVLSADAYAAFEEAGNPLDPATGRRFLREILAVGGERPALESFRAFRGRDPEPDALLRQSGMITGCLSQGVAR
ncbi:MAG: M3 family metallopeptidase [Zoogloeaceae bacterium]|jgi:oligopeptidase A|nr:M3 family metallopeptidase [Zoogloeaceae bacterium]